jgi:hypothetical protein
MSTREGLRSRSSAKAAQIAPIGGARYELGGRDRPGRRSLALTMKVDEHGPPSSPRRNNLGSPRRLRFRSGSMRRLPRVVLNKKYMISFFCLQTFSPSIRCTLCCHVACGGARLRVVLNCCLAYFLQHLCEGAPSVTAQRWRTVQRKHSRQCFCMRPHFARREQPPQAQHRSPVSEVDW